MGRTYQSLEGRLGEFVLRQPVFFVATAPLGATGHVNCSPKGNDGSLIVLGPDRIAYQDQTGSGAETIAHLRENGRIVVMVCAFQGPPRIVRIHGRGRVVVPGEAEWEDLAGSFRDRLGTRAVIVVDAERISDSCGYAVPLMNFESHRSNLDHWAQEKGPEGLVAYREEKNAVSLDGLTALPTGGTPS